MTNILKWHDHKVLQVTERKHDFQVHGGLQYRGRLVRGLNQRFRSVPSLPALR